MMLFATPLLALLTLGLANPVPVTELSPSLPPPLVYGDSAGVSPNHNATECVSFGYATFYDDEHCKSNPSVAFGLNNAACLTNEFNRKSVYVQSSCFSDYHLVFSPEGGCNCQEYCNEWGWGSQQGCFLLTSFPSAGSYRFVSNDCDPNNC